MGASACSKQPRGGDGGGCSRFHDIEDLDGLLLPQRPPTGGNGSAAASSSTGDALAEDEEMMRQLRSHKGVQPLYRARDIQSIHLEMTTHCNAACPQCPRNDQGGAENPLLSKHHSELSLADVRRILPPRLLRGLKKVYLCGNYGDPAVAADCQDVLRYLRGVKGGPKVGLFSNGGMRNPTWWAQLGAVMQPAEKAFVRFAIDGDEATNHLYRQHVNWQRLMANVQAFISAGGNAEWDFIVFEHNEHQVEAMRALAEQMGFAKFTAKKTARFIDRSNGVVRESTDVKNQAGEVVRHLRPPRDPQWQNDAALHSVQRAVSVHGSIEAYYDKCEIHCKAARDKELYISAEGLAFPCCWLAGELYNPSVPNRKRKVVRLVRAANPAEGLEAQSVLRKGGVAAVVDKKGGLFQHLIHAAMRQPSVAAGRLQTCSAVCGAEVGAFAKQFDGAARRPIDPSRRVAAPPGGEGGSRSSKDRGTAAPLLIWYGSETGNSERLALRAAEVLGSAAEVSSPPRDREQFLPEVRDRTALVLVLTTWGQGEPTDDAVALFEWLRGLRSGGAEKLALPVAVYGVGSSLWPLFNAAARRAVELLGAAGVPLLAPPGECDASAGDVDGQFEGWLGDVLLPALRERGITQQEGAAAVALEAERPQDAVPLTVRRCVRLASGDAAARYFAVELEGALTHGLGDAVGVLPPASGPAGARRPRWYTVSSAPARDRQRAPGVEASLRLTVREVPGGICSPWLASLREGDEVWCLPPRRPSHLFAAWEARRGEGAAPPLLLVAAGAGVAPFMALLELLASKAASKPGGEQVCMLWMGCRQRADALPHGPELTEFLQSGVLQRLSVAESRPPGEGGRRQFVQDKLLEDADEVGQLLYPSACGAERAIMLVCGAAAMGSTVRKTIAGIAEKFGGSIEGLEQERRYAAELW